jgi:heat shock protein HslJ
VTGSDGCNTINGPYDVKGDALTFGNLRSTAIGCPNTRDVQRAFLDAILAATRWRVIADRREFLDATGAIVARFAADAASRDLVGTTWRLVNFVGGDGARLTPDDPSKYTLAFHATGRLTAQIDCNTLRFGTWSSSGPSQVQFGAMTDAKCPQGSLHDEIVKQWAFERSYVLKGGHLFLSLQADGGVFEFEPLAQRR